MGMWRFFVFCCDSAEKQAPTNQLLTIGRLLFNSQ
jgi:hypothetical protein